MSVDPRLLGAWAAARSKARSLPAPIPEYGGFRIETGSDAEVRRWIFPGATPVIADLARQIDQPRVLVKACLDVAELAALIPSHWFVEPTGWVMLHPGDPPATASAPQGFELVVDRNPDSFTAILNTRDRNLAASGHAAACDGVFAYDRIIVEPAFRRLGLGTTIMAALAACRPAETQPMLIATNAGRELYETLGWAVVSPYATAFIPA